MHSSTTAVRVRVPLYAYSLAMGRYGAWQRASACNFSAWKVFLHHPETAPNWWLSICQMSGILNHQFGAVRSTQGCKMQDLTGQILLWLSQRPTSSIAIDSTGTTIDTAVVFFMRAYQKYGSKGPRGTSIVFYWVFPNFLQPTKKVWDFRPSKMGKPQSWQNRQNDFLAAKSQQLRMQEFTP